MFRGLLDIGRWFYFKPRSGLNDVLCQVQQASRVARATGRQLLVESSDSSLLMPLDDLFVPETHRVRWWSAEYHPEVLEVLNSAEIFPSQLFGNLHRRNWYRKIPGIEAPELQPLMEKPGWSAIMQAARGPVPVVAHESGGGGFRSTCFVRNVSLQPQVAAKIVTNLANLPDDYIAVHVRHTDLKNDLESILNSKIIQESDRPVFLASDHPDVRREFEKTIGQDRIVGDPEITVQDPGVPLHKDFSDSPLPDRVLIMTKTLTDLFGLSGARDFVYGAVNHRRGAGASGFSRLAGFLATAPHARASLLYGHRASSPFPKTLPSRLHFVGSKRLRLREAATWLKHSNCLGAGWAQFR